MTSRRLDPAEKRRRRQERLRLIAFLHRGGRLVREDLPAGVVAWVPASRSGPAYSSRAFGNLSRRGCTIRGDKFKVVHADDGSAVLAVVSLAPR